jgi:hypothetical protein
MPKFPEPPSTAFLRHVGADVVSLLAGTRLYRVFYKAGPHPTAWNVFRNHGPVATARFDHHVPPRHNQDRAIQYAATSIPICIAEVFQTSRVIDRRSGDPWVAAFDLAQDLPLLDLRGIWPTRAGTSQAISSSPLRERAQRWSRRLYESYPGDVAGLVYRSSMFCGDTTVAIYERASPYLPNMPVFEFPLMSPGLSAPLDHLRRTLHYRLL